MSLTAVGEAISAPSGYGTCSTADEHLGPRGGRRLILDGLRNLAFTSRWKRGS